VQAEHLADAAHWLRSEVVRFSASGSVLQAGPISLNRAFSVLQTLPKLLARTSISGTPRLAMIAGSAVAGVAARSGTYLKLVAVVVPLTAGIIASINLAAIVMRRKEPDLPRPFKMPLFPLPSVLGICLNLTLLTAMVIDDPWHSLVGIVAALVLGATYAVMGRGPAVVATPQSPS
jgi:APA family basic amino acid/polyamine antiporter